MTNLTHIPPTAAHRDAIRKSGFDLDDPHRRHPVRNPKLDRLRGRAELVRNSPAEQLLRARAGPDKGRIRSLAFLGAGVAGLLPKKAAAFAPDYIIVLLEEPSRVRIVRADPSLVDPIWVPLLLTALLVSVLASLFTLTRLENRLRKAITMEPGMPQLETSESSTTGEPTLETAEQAPTKWLVDKASRTGKIRSENQDSFGTWNRGEQGPVLVLCDGAGGVEGGRQAAQTATVEILSDLRNALSDPEAQGSCQTLERAFDKARQTAETEALTGVTTAIAAVVSEDILHYATLGDGALAVVWPDGMVTQLLTPHHTAGMPTNIINAYIGDGCTTPARTGSVRLERGCTVFLMSDGAGDLFPFEAFAGAHEQHINLWKDEGTLADGFLQEIENACDPETGDWLHHDNMTIVVAHFLGEEVRDA